MNTLSSQWKEYGLGCPHFLQVQTRVKQMLRNLFPDWIYFISLYWSGQCHFSKHSCRSLFRLLACLWVDQWDRLFLLPRFCAGSLFWMASLHCQLDWVQNQQVNRPLTATVRMFPERFCWEWKTHSERGQHLPLGCYILSTSEEVSWAPASILLPNTKHNTASHLQLLPPCLPAITHYNLNM